MIYPLLSSIPARLITGSRFRPDAAAPPSKAGYCSRGVAAGGPLAGTMLFARNSSIMRAKVRRSPRPVAAVSLRRLVTWAGRRRCSVGNNFRSVIRGNVAGCSADGREPVPSAPILVYDEASFGA
jgi:hypothetical protein